MKNQRPLLLGLISLALTVALARLDSDATSFASIARFENVPAFFLYTAGFFGMLTMLFGWRRPAPVPVRVRPPR